MWLCIETGACCVALLEVVSERSLMHACVRAHSHSLPRVLMRAFALIGAHGMHLYMHMHSWQSCVLYDFVNSGTQDFVAVSGNHAMQLCREAAVLDKDASSPPK